MVETIKWKAVSGLEGCYEVSSDGQVRSLTRRARTGRVLKSFRTRGYLYVNMTKNGARTRKPVHELVLVAFTGPKPKGAEHARHLDGDSLNNKEHNLAWGTAQDNADDRRRYGSFLFGEANPNAKITWKKAGRIRTLLAKKTPYARVAERFGVSVSLVGRIARGEAWPVERAV